MRSGAEDRSTFETAQRRLLERRIPLTRNTAWGEQACDDDEVGGYSEEIGLFPRDKKLMHGVSWLRKRSGLRKRAHRWLEFDQVGSVWVYWRTNGSPFKFMGLELRLNKFRQKVEFEEDEDCYWVCFGEFRVFGPFYRPEYASELAGLLAADLGVKCDPTPREHPASGQVVRPGERAAREVTPAMQVLEEPLPARERDAEPPPRPPREREPAPEPKSKRRLPPPPRYGS